MDCDKCVRHAAFAKIQAEMVNLDVSEKAEYTQALERAPHLVLLESDPLRFLRFANYSSIVAARAIAKYWKRRVRVFGEQSAFLPLVLTGDGALSKEDIAFISHGLLVFLPPDAEGHFVTFTDPSRRLIHKLDVRLRGTFYYGQIMSEHPRAHTKGVVSIVLVTEPKWDENTHACVDLLSSTFPIAATKGSHTINAVPSWSNSWLVRAFTKSVIGTLGQMFFQYPAFFYAPSSKEELLKSLEKQGLSKDGLPERIGGSWTYEKFAQWMTERTEQDRMRYPSCAPRSTNDGTCEICPSKLQTLGAGLEEPEKHPPQLPPVYEIYSISMVQLDISFEQLPLQDTAAYRRALQMAPVKVWKLESNPHWFLRVEFLHPWMAARRLARYWTMRLGCFSDAGLDALTQTGEDALERQDNRVLQSGFASPLPVDSTGRPVLFINAALLEKNHQASHVQRVLFYMFSLLAENERSRSDGAILIVRAGTPFFELIGASFLSQLALTVPVLFQKVVLVPLEELSPDMVSSFHFADSKVLVDGASADEKASGILQDSGMQIENLPSCFGGNWDYAKFLHWRELRTRLEWRVPLHLSGRSNELESFPAMRPYSTLGDDQKVERERRLNVIHARRKQDRKRFSMQVDSDL